MKIGYGRVSKLDQDPQLQIDALKGAGCDKLFIEKISSRKELRPEWVNANSHLRSGDTLVVWKLDRIARSVLELELIAKDLQSRGVELKVLTQNLDTGTPEGKLMFTMIAAFAQFERDLVQQRTKAGLMAAREQGRFGGRRKEMTEEKRKLAQTLLANPEMSVRDVLRVVGVSKSVFYREFKGGRTKE